MSVNLPANGQTIVFTVLPTGSWASTGEPYIVEQRNPRCDVYLRNAWTGAGTFDRPWTYRSAVWSVTVPASQPTRRKG